MPRPTRSAAELRAEPLSRSGRSRGSRSGSEHRRRRRALLLRALPLLLLALIVFLVGRHPEVRDLLREERLLAELERVRAVPGVSVLFVLVTTGACALGAPITLFLLAGGAVFGWLPGALIAYVATLSASLACYGLGRLLGAPFLSAGFRRHQLLIERMLRRRGFFPLILLRFVPIPFLAQNVILGSLRIRPLLFLVTGAISYAPVVLIWTYFADALVGATGDDRTQVLTRLGLAVVALALLAALPILLQRLARRRRLEQLRQDRS